MSTHSDGKERKPTEAKLASGSSLVQNAAPKAVSAQSDKNYTQALAIWRQDRIYLIHQIAIYTFSIHSVDRSHVVKQSTEIKEDKNHRNRKNGHRTLPGQLKEYVN